MEEEIVAKTQPELAKDLSGESSESTDEWEPVKKPKRKRRKTNEQYKERARESTTLRWMKHCCVSAKIILYQIDGLYLELYLYYL